MRRATKQNDSLSRTFSRHDRVEASLLSPFGLSKTFLQAPVWAQNVDESPFSAPGTCRKPSPRKQENAHYISRRHHYYLMSSFYLQVSEHFE